MEEREYQKKKKKSLGDSVCLAPACNADLGCFMYCLIPAIVYIRLGTLYSSGESSFQVQFGASCRRCVLVLWLSRGWQDFTAVKVNLNANECSSSAQQSFCNMKFV